MPVGCLRIDLVSSRVPTACHERLFLGFDVAELCGHVRDGFNGFPALVRCVVGLRVLKLLNIWLNVLVDVVYEI